MKNFKTILIVTLILDVIQFLPLALVSLGDEMKNQMISDFNIEGLANSAPALEVLDLMFYVFGFIYLGTFLETDVIFKPLIFISFNKRLKPKNPDPPTINIFLFRI